MHLFYTPDLDNQTTFNLSEDESRHCCQVLRLHAGDIIHLINGKGGFYTAEIVNANPKSTQIQIIERQQEYGKRNHYLHIAIAPTKSIDRLEWFLEKATEIGIDEITPLICERSERKEVKPDRLNKVLVAAMKQSLKAWLPTLNPAIRYKHFIAQLQTSGRKPQTFICSCDAPLTALLKNIYKPHSETLLLIGPEGDFSNEELEVANKSGFESVSLGESRLRTETAGVVVCT